MNKEEPRDPLNENQEQFFMWEQRPRAGVTEFIKGYVSGSSLSTCAYPEELNEFAEKPAGNFQGDKAIFCTPTTSTEKRAAENEELGLFEYCGSLQHRCLVVVGVEVVQLRALYHAQLQLPWF